MTASWQTLLDHPGANDHIAQVYCDDAFLREATARFVAAGVRQGDGMVLIMRAENWDAVARSLKTEGLDVAGIVRRGQIAVHDADATLAALMKGGIPDAAAFDRIIGGMIRDMRNRFPLVRAFGEMVDILWQGDRRDAATSLEKFWHELGRVEPFSLLCAYHIDPLDEGAYHGHVEGICSTHTHLIPDRDYDRFDDAISQASHDVLDQSAVMMVESLAVKDKPRTSMPFGQAVILWMSENMPRTAEKVLARARLRYRSTH